MVIRVPAGRNPSRARVRPGRRARRGATGQPLPSHPGRTVTRDGAAAVNRVPRAPRAPTYPGIRTTGNGRRNRGAAGPATCTAPESGAVSTGLIPAEAKVGAGTGASWVDVGVGDGDGVGSGVG